MIDATSSDSFDALFQGVAVSGAGHDSDQATTLSARGANHVGQPTQFVPLAPASLEAAGVSEHRVEQLALKFLLNSGSASGWEIAEQIALPYRIVERVLHAAKAQRLVVFRGTSMLGDYLYELTDLGTERAARAYEHSTYCGAAPVPLAIYVASVEAQALARQTPSLADLKTAFADLELGQSMLARLGEALTAGLGFFLYGPPGNGKTSIAERVTRAYGEGIWIPRALDACGEIIRLYDPACHEAIAYLGANTEAETAIDQRWIYIRRPTIVAGGELTLEHLELTRNPATGVHEAPLQLKSNGGALVIDDFGRQRVSIEQLLNRWILPLERRFDLLSMPSGKKFRVPFNQLIVFATNLEPRHLVDEAFLRRIPYKIEAIDPTEEQFRSVWQRVADELGVATSSEVVEHLLEKHYRNAGRALRYCHARDILKQIFNHTSFHQLPAVTTTQSVDWAVENYFGLA